ncbi:MAG: beta strand repeat-containing protein, partial [Gammaproteobacteria bacterium]
VDAATAIFTAGGTLTAAGKQLAVAGEGTWRINAAGALGFTPVANFTGLPSVVTVDDNAGNTSNAVNVVLVDKAPPVAVPDSANFTGAAVTVQVADDDGAGENGGAGDVDVDSIVFVTPDPGDTLSPEGKTLTAAGQGVWTVGAGGNLTFTPTGGFIGVPKLVYYTVDDNAAVPNTSLRASITLADIGAPPVQDDNADFTGVAVTVDALANDGGAGKVLVPATVAFVGTTNPDGSKTVAGEGTWTINAANGQITFTPQIAAVATNFTGTPASVQYTVEDDQGNPSAAATVSLNDKALPVGLDDAGNFDGNPVANIIVITNDGTGFGENAPLKTDSVLLTTSGIVGATLSPDGKQLTVPNEGAWTVTDTGPNAATLTFTPITRFSGTPSVIEYTVDDAADNTSLPTRVTLSDIAKPPAQNDVDDFDGNPVTVDVLANDAIAGETLDPASVQIVGTALPGDALPVAGEGTWTVEANGSLTFTPVPGFVDVPTVISYSVADNVTPAANRSDVVTVTLNDTAPPAATDDLAANQDPGNVTVDVPANDANGGPLDLTSVVFVDPPPSGGAVSNGGRTLTIVGEGVWTADTTTGAITFAPEVGFTDDPSVVTYRIADPVTPTANTATATLTIDYKPVAQDDPQTPAGTPATVLVDVLANDDALGDAPVANTVRLLDDTNTQVTTYTVAGEGTWTVNTASGVITFAPLGTLNADPTPVNYVVQDAQGNLSDPAEVSIDYGSTPDPTADNDTEVAQPPGAVTLDVVDGDLPATPGTAIDPATVQIVGTANPGDSLAVTGEGTWSVNATSGAITFTPTGGFTDDPTPISYTVMDDSTPTVRTTNAAVVSIDYAPVASNDTGVFGGNAVTVSVAGNDTAGDAVDPTTVRLVDGSGTPQTTLAVVGEGTWTVDTTHSTRTFKPIAVLTGTKVDV